MKSISFLIYGQGSLSSVDFPSATIPIIMKSLSKETLLSGDSINDKNDLPPQYTPSSSNHVESSIYTPIYTQMAAMCLDLNTLLPSNAKDFASHFEQEFAKLTPRDPPIAQQLGLRNLNATIQICALTMKLIDKNGERLDPFDPAHKNHLERRSEYRYAYPMRQNIMHNLATLCDNLDTLLALLHELSTANILEPDQKERILILVEMASLPISERVLVLHKQCIRLLQLAGLHVEGTVESINVDVLAREHWKRLSTLMKMISPEEFKKQVLPLKN